MLGVVFGVGKLSDHPWIRWPAWTFVEFFRAVPLLMLIIFIWALQEYPTDSLLPLIIGLILYNGSVLAEVFRAGILAVPKGQSEAAYAIGMRKNQVMRIVQLPQAVKIMLPAIISQCIVALKDTSLGFYILAPVLTAKGREIWNFFDNKFATAIVLAAVYIVLNLLLDLAGDLGRAADQCHRWRAGHDRRRTGAVAGRSRRALRLSSSGSPRAGWCPARRRCRPCGWP